MTRTEAGSHHESEVEANVRIVVRMLMAARGIRPAELALKLGVSKTAVFNRLGGQKPFTLSELGDMADLFDVPPSVLLAGPNALLRTAEGPITHKKLSHVGGVNAAVPQRRPTHRALAPLRLVA